MRQRHRKDGYANDHYQKNRHQDPAVIFNSFVYSPVNNKCGQKQVDKQPDDRLPHACDIAGKITVLCGFHPMSGDKGSQIFQYPSTDGTVIGQNHNRNDTRQNAKTAPFGVNHPVRIQRTLSGFSSDGYICGQQRKTKGQCQNNVNQNESSSSILRCQIRKSPDISQSDSTSCCCKYESNRSGKISSFVSFLHTLLTFYNFCTLLLYPDFRILSSIFLIFFGFL